MAPSRFPRRAAVLLRALVVAYRHHHDRPGVDLPQTARPVTRRRPAGTDGLFGAWGTLTHAAGTR